MEKAIGLDGRSIDKIMEGEGRYTNTAKARSDRARGVEPLDVAQPEAPRKMQSQGRSAKEKFEQTRQKVIERAKARGAAEPVRSYTTEGDHGETRIVRTSLRHIRCTDRGPEECLHRKRVDQQRQQQQHAKR